MVRLDKKAIGAERFVAAGSDRRECFGCSDGGRRPSSMLFGVDAGSVGRSVCGMPSCMYVRLVASLARRVPLAVPYPQLRQGHGYNGSAIVCSGWQHPRTGVFRGVRFTISIDPRVIRLSRTAAFNVIVLPVFVVVVLCLIAFRASKGRPAEKDKRETWV